MPFAALCLRNALTLTRVYIDKLFSLPLNDDKQDNSFCQPSGPASRESFDIILSSIYAAFSYVSLRLGNYVTALEMAEELLRTEKLSDAHK